jgi:hypothetical protein
MLGTSMSDGTEIAEEEIDISEQKLRRIRKRVLEAEKGKLHLDLPRGINNEIEEIIREEIN